MLTYSLQSRAPIGQEISMESCDWTGYHLYSVSESVSIIIRTAVRIVLPGQWCPVQAHRVTCHAAQLQPCVSIYSIYSIYLSTKAFTQASLLTRSLNQLYPPEFRVAKCRICPISGLLLTPCTPLHTIRRKQGRGSLDQWTADTRTLSWTWTPE